MPTNLLAKPIISQTEIEALIPQRSPIVMVDKLLHFSNQMVVSGLSISSDNIFVGDHSFTEAGLIENMAQTVALYTGYQSFIKNEPAPVGYIGAIKKTMIHRLPKVGEDLKTTAHILHEIMDVTLVKVKVEWKGQEIASAEMKTVIAKK